MIAHWNRLNEAHRMVARSSLQHRQMTRYYKKTYKIKMLKYLAIYRCQRLDLATIRRASSRRFQRAIFLSFYNHQMARYCMFFLKYITCHLLMLEMRFYYHQNRLDETIPTSYISFFYNHQIARYYNFCDIFELNLMVFSFPDKILLKLLNILTFKTY